MHFDTHDQLVLVALLIGLAALLIAAPVFRIPYPIFLVLGGLALGFVPGVPDHRAAAGRRARRRAAAAPLRLRVLHLRPRPTRERPCDRHPRRRSRPRDDGDGCRRRARSRRRSVVERGVRARRGRRADRSDRGDGDHAPPRRAAAARVDRRDARASSTTAPRSCSTASRSSQPSPVQFSIWDASWRFVWSVVGGIGIGLVVGCVDRAGAPPSRQSAGRGDDRADDGLHRLHPRERGRGLGRARRRDRRRLPGLAHRRADVGADPAAGSGGLGDRHLRAQRVAVRARRAAAVEHPRLAHGHPERGPRSGMRCSSPAP